jgi:hypothetical protein
MNRIILSLLAIIMLASCTNYGKKVKSGHIEVYYKSGVTEDEARKTAALLELADKAAGNDISNKKSFQLLREGDTTTLRMVVRKEKINNVKDENFYAIGNLVSDSIFDTKPVNIDLTDDHFKSFHLVRYKKIETNSDANTAAFGEKVTEGKTEVYMKGANTNESTLLAGYLNDYFKPEAIYSFQLVKDERGNYTVKMVGNPDRINTLDNKFFEGVCKGICDKVLSVPSVSFEMTDTKFNSLRIFNYPADTGTPDRNN